MTTLSMADIRTQWFADNYPGAKIAPNIIVLHTTETTSWPGYEGGATAPHLTILPVLADERLQVRQHFPFEMSSRALRNDSGGVETNTANALQIELIGTCSKPYADRADALHWPTAPEWAIRELAVIMRELDAKLPGVVLRDAAPRGWLPYPKSYGTANGQRMSFSEWRAATGICGHQHVPENTHGDPGAFPIKQLLLLAAAKPAVVPSKPAPAKTRVRLARRLLRKAEKTSREKGNVQRAEQIASALEQLPKE